MSTFPATPKKIYPRASEKCTSVSISNAGKKRALESPNNLSQFRWNHTLPGPDEDEELVRLAKAGERKAGAQIVKNYHRTIVGLAGKHKISYQAHRGRKQHTNGARDDLIGRGFEALWRAVLSWDASKGRFSSYARQCIAGQISKEATAFVKRGSVGETRIERWLFSHPRATPGELVAAFKKRGAHISWSEAEYEIKQFKARCSWHRYEPPADYVDEPM